MNYLYLDGVAMPVTPSKLTTKIANRNNTIDLVNGYEVNVLKNAGLTNISFELLIPAKQYPFAHYDNGFLTPNYYLALFEGLKSNKKPFQFIFTRTNPDSSVFWDTNLTVSLEDYEIVETSAEGNDVIVTIHLKQYRQYGTKKISISTDGTVVTVIGNNRLQSSTTPKTYTVKEGDTLWRICRTIVGDESKFQMIADQNGIINPNNLTVGTVLDLDV